MYIKEFSQLKKSTHNMINSDYEYDHMVYVRLFEGCNLFCEHCFIPSNPKKINELFYENNNLTQELVKNNVPSGSKLYLQWHGGEPTILGVDYLKKAIDNVEADSRFSYKHGIQTNLLNFSTNTNEWVKLYKEKFNNQLGVSWDYGIRHIKNNQLTSKQSNEQFEDIFWKNIALAKDYGLELYMVVTVTKLFFEHFKNPFDFFEIMEKNGIEKLNFERITKTGFARNSWDKLGLSNLEYSTNMSKFFKAYIVFKNNNLDSRIQISPFDGLLESVIGLNSDQELQKSSPERWDVLSYKNQGYGCWNGSCDTKFHTIDANGYKKGCTALNSEEDNKNKDLSKTIKIESIKWISKDSNTKLNKALEVNSFQEFRNDRQKSCTGCDFLSICSSGCLSVEKFDESGECSGAKHLFKTIQDTIKQQFAF